jgi:hypothetical protein
MSGTLLSDLDTSSQPNSTDGDLVQKILNDMNDSPAPPQVTSRQATPANQMQMQMQMHPSVINTPNPNSTFQHSMDNVPPTAHIIGNEHPTNADFAAMMYAKQNNQGQGQGQGAPWQQYTQPAPPPYVPKKSWYSGFIYELKTPILVALVFFVFSLPFVNVLFAHYIPRLVKGTGELNLVGLVIKSLLAGSAFWVVNRVIPLLTS